MRILHYISHVRREDLLSQYLSTLTTAQEKLGAEIAIATQRDDVTAKMKLFHPHIVHIHTLWSLHAAEVARQARRNNCGVVVSPHGQLDAYRCRNERRWHKKMATMLFQRRMIARADALMPTTEREAKRLEDLAWNDHIDLVGNAMLASRVTQEQMAELSLRLYRKVLDTRYAHYLTPEDYEMVGTLLHAAIDHTPTSPIPAERIDRLQTLDADKWRRICLWADDEDVMPLLHNGTQRLAIDTATPAIDPSAIDRYPRRRPKQKGQLPDDELLNASEMAKDKWKEVLQNESEPLRQVVTLLLNARTLSRTKTLSLHHLCDLYRAIKLLDYDEDRLKSLLDRFSATRFARGVVGLLDQKLLLGEGFLPLPPRQTRRILRIPVS